MNTMFEILKHFYVHKVFFWIRSLLFIFSLSVCLVTDISTSRHVPNLSADLISGLHIIQNDFVLI